MVRAILKNSIHTSSLYAIKLLHYLEEAPLTCRQLQERFLNDPDCEQSFSVDTLRLYANALEEAGCILERPTNANDYHYALRHQPFAFHLDAADWQALYQALEKKFLHSSVSEFIRLYRLCNFMAKQSFLKDEQREALQKLLASFIVPQCFHFLPVLEHALPQQSCFRICYESPRLKHTWYASHETVVMFEGRLYWLCYQHDEVSGEITPMMLRINRISSMVAVHEGGSLSPDTPSMLNVAKAGSRLKQLVKEQPRFSFTVLLPIGVNFMPPQLLGESLGSATLEAPDELRILQQAEAFYETQCYGTFYTVQSAHHFFLLQALRYTGGLLIPRNLQSCKLLQSG